MGTNTNQTINYTYDANLFLTQESGILNTKNYTKTYQYDNKYRLTNTTETTPFLITQHNISYDNYGRLNTKNIYAYLAINANYTNGNKTIKYNYNNWNGMNDKIQDNTDLNNYLWQITNANENMQPTNGNLGNGTTILNFYNNVGLPTNLYNYTYNTNILNVSYTYNIAKGLTLSRNNAVANYNEIFSFDVEDRLVSWTSPNGTQTHSYTDDGRINTSDEVGTYNYNNPTRYNLQSLTLNYTGNNRNATHQPLTATYNMFKDPVSITENTTVNFEYNLKNQRSFVTYTNNTKFKVYSEDEQVEVLETKQANGTYTIRFITYLDGDAYSANLVYVKETIYPTQSFSFEGFYYLHRDNQGTILSITNSAGSVVESRVFDPWGNLKQGTISFIERGYTGHEHFTEISIIHMNGRIYDPFTKLFLQPDNILDNNNPQSYNRYAYCLNNPLKYIDPNGEEAITLGGFLIYTAIATVVASAVYTISVHHSGEFNWDGLGKAALQGAISGAVSFGVGAAFGSVGTFWHELGRAAAHGLTQATLSDIYSEGKSQFWSSFASGAVSSLVGSGISSLQIKDKYLKTLFMYIGGTVSGGLSATITGGNFLEGATIGLVVTALNHALHEALDPDPKKQNDKNKQTTNNQVKEKNCQTCLDEKTKNKNLFGTNYVGHNNPKNTNGNDNYSLPPINEADANALEHDLRYDKMKVSGLRGLLEETSAIGADYVFVFKQFKTAFLSPYNIQNSATGVVSGIFIGIVAFPKTIYQLSQPYSLIKIFSDYNIYK